MERRHSTMKRPFSQTINHRLGTILVILLLLSMSPAHTESATFKDVSSSHWAYIEITSLSNQGVIAGYDDRTFRPSATVTRAQAAKFLAMSLNLKPSATFTPKFKDVTPSHWAYDYISPLAERGIFANTDAFHPNAPITRAQMAKIISKGFDIIVDDNDQYAFRDVPNTNEFHSYIVTIAERGITTNPNGGVYNPSGIVQRAHFAAFIYRANQFAADRESGILVYDQARKMYVNKLVPTPQPQIEDMPLEVTETIPLVNKIRTLHSKTTLQHDAALSRIAQAKAEDLAKLGYFSHTSPTYGTVGQMLDKFNYPWTAYGENIAKGYVTPQSVVDAWMASPGHKENILSSKFTHIGVGYDTSADGTPYWVHLYSRK